jgi:homoserine dehydrogenase
VPPVSDVRIGLLGLGTVGAGVVKILQNQRAMLQERTGAGLTLAAIADTDLTRPREGLDIRALPMVGDAARVLDDPTIHVVVELVGGLEPARTFILRALAAGKHVVTANKALLAHHGAELYEEARRRGVSLGFEAAVAGGIPVIKALREGLAGNRISNVAGILNGTCNYILTQMRERGREFADVLADAQKLGYAEADPSFDIDGIDAAHKLAILAALAFGRPVAFDQVYVEGIRRVSALDIAFATELGYRIKLLGIARQTEAGIETRVHPCMVPQTAPIAGVDGVFNAVVAEGDFVGRVMLEGRGAGAGPTASAIVADLIDIARDRMTPVWGASAASLSTAPSVPMSNHVGAYYLRLMVVDRPGVIADVTAILRDIGVSLESMLQRGRSPGEAVPVVLVTHETRESSMREALDRIGALPTVMEEPTLIRIEVG